MTARSVVDRRVPAAIAWAVLVCCLAASAVADAGTPAGHSYGNAPAFTRADLDGHDVSLADYRGKVVLLNFWATWCSPCLGEIPRFAAWQRTYGGRGLRIVGVSMDDEQAPVQAAYRKYGLNYPVVMGDAKLGELYGGILGLPVTLLIDARGEIRFRHRGASDLDMIEREIRTLLPAR
jgi:cytochrome c biogenesis protein CcmG/thiol:disulfide interchange protein DsbE